jgi:hypothetical protein
MRPTPDLVFHVQHVTYFVQSEIVASCPPGPSFCLNLFFRISYFILLMTAMASRVVHNCWKVFYLFDVMNPT